MQISHQINLTAEIQSNVLIKNKQENVCVFQEQPAVIKGEETPQSVFNSY